LTENNAHHFFFFFSFYGKLITNLDSANTTHHRHCHSHCEQEMQQEEEKDGDELVAAMLCRMDPATGSSKRDGDAFPPSSQPVDVLSTNTLPVVSVSTHLRAGTRVRILATDNVLQRVPNLVHAIGIIKEAPGVSRSQTFSSFVHM
jgi:hypothetical protein